MELLESWIGALAMLTEPYWLTLQALGGMIVTAGAGTTIFGSLLLLLSLDLLRGSKGGPLVIVWRTAAVASAFFLLASVTIGDFMAAPAKAAYTAIVARSPAVPSGVVALSTLGAAGAGLIFYAGRQTAPRVAAHEPRRPSMSALMSARREAGGFRVADFGKTLSLDPAGRLQLRQLSRNPKKTANFVRPALRGAVREVHLAQAGRRFA
jgi:hypothetical protein